MTASYHNTGGAHQKGNDHGNGGGVQHGKGNAESDEAENNFNRF